VSLDALRRRTASRKTELQSRRIIVLAGGSSSEREVSLNSGLSVVAALQKSGYHAQLAEIDAKHPLLLRAEAGSEDLLELTALCDTAQSGSDDVWSARPPLIVSMLHGSHGENGSWQGLLELLDLPHTSAGVKGSAVAMDKVISKRLFESLGVPTPSWTVLSSSASENSDQDAWRGQTSSKSLKASRLVGKPVSEGSSVGLLIFDNTPAGWEEARRHSRRHGELLVEEHISGRELTIAVLGPSGEASALPLVEIRPAGDVYDYEHKYTAGASEYICPADIDPRAAELIVEDSLLIYRSLSLEPCARMDLLLDQQGQWYFLEANTLPGFTQTSLLPKAAQAAGLTYTELIELLMLCALERWEGSRVREVA
jgi:D-alanine--D-alanine ligase